MLGLATLILGLTIAAPPTGAFEVRRAGGAPVSGNLARLEADLAITFEGDSGPAVAAGDLVTLRRKGVPRPAPPTGPHVVFANGDRLAGTVVAINNDRVRFKAAVGSELSIPLPALAVLWFQAPPADTGPELARRWTSERRRRDLVLTRNGDTRSGTVKELKPGGPLLLSESGRDTRLDAAQVVAIAMNTDLARTLRPRGPYARLVLANGDRLSVVAPTAGAFDFSAKTLFAEQVTLKLDQLAALDVRQGKAISLSDLKPKSYEHRPFLGVRWPYEMDRSVAGGPLLLGGSYFDKGVGLHSESRLTFALNGQYRRFEALVGLDDVAGHSGRAIARVLVDGKPKGDLGRELSPLTGPRQIEVDVSGARELTLVVEFGAGGDVGDHVDWAEARLIR